MGKEKKRMRDNEFKARLRSQLLHSYRIVFPTTKELPDLSQKEYRAEEPDYFLKLKKQLL